MAIITSMCNSAKSEFLQGIHSATHTYKIALIAATATGSYNSGTVTSYTQLAGEEVASGSGYTTGGGTLTGYAAALTAGTGSIDWADYVWTSSSISSIGALIYNDTVASKPALGVFDFGGTVTSTSGSFTVQIPSSGTGLIRYA